jgi:hypothetical protein
MSKKSLNTYDKALLKHEKCMGNLLSTVSYLCRFIRNETLKPNPRVYSTQEDFNSMYRIDLFEKMMKEDYIFNDYQALREMVIETSTNNMIQSRTLIEICLKNLNMYSSSIGSYLAVLKELLIIDDTYNNRRRELILGLPCVRVFSTYTKPNIKFGIQCDVTTDKPIYEYFPF